MLLLASQHGASRVPSGLCLTFLASVVISCVFAARNGQIRGFPPELLILGFLELQSLD